MKPRSYFRKLLYFFCPFLILCFLMSCGSDSSKNTPKDLADSLSSIKQLEKAKKIFYSVPAPHEIASLLMEYPDAKYNEEFLNPTGNASGYNSTKSMALNLGIYLTDLCYANLFEQSQTTMNYTYAAKKLATSLGILNSLDDKTITKLKENINNKDAIIKIMSESFMSTDSYLQENNRQEVAAMVLSGGWIEAIFIAVQLSDRSATKNKELATRIADQQLTMSLILSLLEEYKTDKDISLILKEFNDINTEYAQLQSEKGQIDAKKYTAFCDKVIKLRNDFIK